MDIDNAWERSMSRLVSILAPSIAILGVSRAFRRWELTCRQVSGGGVSLGDAREPPSHSFLCGSSVQSHAPTMIYCLTTGLRQLDAFMLESNIRNGVLLIISKKLLR